MKFASWFLKELFIFMSIVHFRIIIHSIEFQKIIRFFLTSTLVKYSFRFFFLDVREDLYSPEDRESVHAHVPTTVHGPENPLPVHM